MELFQTLVFRILFPVLFYIKFNIRKQVVCHYLAFNIKSYKYHNISSHCLNTVGEMNYILLAAFVIVIAGVVSAQSEGKFKLSAEQKSKFNNWKLKHKKVYKNDTAEGKAANKYVTNAQKAAEHNSNPNATYTQGDTEDSDMSYEEKVSKRMGFRAPENAKETKFPKKLKAAQTQTAPKAVNYTKLMYPIKNQGNCGKSFQSKLKSNDAN